MKSNNLFIFLFLFPVSLFSSVTCTFKGRLGNELFQIAATMCLAEELNTDSVFYLRTPHHNVQEELERNYKEVFPNIKLRRTRYPEENTFKEKGYEYKEIPLIDNTRLVGYFQSEEYFKKHKEKILPYFLPTEKRVKKLYAKHPWLLEKTTVAVHLRCYFREDINVRMTWGILSKDYFLKAMALFPEDTLFVFFSDDIELCKKLFRDSVKNARFIEGQDGIDDFYMMSLCNHNIISNSTYSWWSAYLNQNPEKIVVAPSLWIAGDLERSNAIIPKDWVKIDFDTENPIREYTEGEKRPVSLLKGY